MKLMIATVVLLVLPQEKVELRWKFQKGQEFRYRMTQKSTIDMAGVTMEQTMRMTLAYQVEEVSEDGTASLKIKYESVAAKSEGPVEYDYDSERDKEAPKNPALVPMARMVGLSLQMKMEPTGRIREVKGFNQLIDALLKELENEPQAAMMREMFKQSFSDEALQSTFQQSSFLLPSSPVAKGESWKEESTLKLPMIGKMTMSGQTRLADLRGPEAYLEQDFKMEPREDKAPADPNNPMAGLVQVSGVKVRSKAVFSLERGRLLQIQSDTTMTMTAAGQEMETHVVNEMRLLEEKPRRDY